MEIDIYHPGRYRLRQLGSEAQQLFQLSSRFPAKNAHYHGAHWRDVIVALIDRTWFVNKILPCDETASAAGLLEYSIPGYKTDRVHVLDEGHVYEFGNGKPKHRQILTFVKRSSEAVHYSKEWPGVQSQEVMRMLMDHVANERANRHGTFLLDGYAPEEYMQNALYQYEARAYRRHAQGKNRGNKAHAADSDAKDLRDHGYFLDIPFRPEHVDLLSVGSDGHVRMPRRKRALRSQIALVQGLLR